MSRVPGTFKKPVAAAQRLLTPEARAITDNLAAAGALAASVWTVGECGAILAREPGANGYLWHLSISHESRYPTWDEIKTAIYSIPDLADYLDQNRGRVMAQLLGRVDDGDWVDVHKNCFHLYEIEDPL